MESNLMKMTWMKNCYSSSVWYCRGRDAPWWGLRRLASSSSSASSSPPSSYSSGLRIRLIHDFIVELDSESEDEDEDEDEEIVPQGWTMGEWKEKRETDPKAVAKAARASMKVQVKAMCQFHAMGVPTVDYGNNIRQMALEEGLENAFDFPGFVPAYIRPLFCRGIGPFRWVALSGDPEDIRKTDAKMKELFPDNKDLHILLGTV